MKPYRTQKEEPNNQIWIKIFGFIVIFSFLVAGYYIVQETYKKLQIKKEVDDLKKQAEELEQGNQKLKGLIEYYKTIGYSEKEAREKLNVKKEGEKVVMIKSEEKKKESAEQKTANNINENFEKNFNNNMPNPIKWWDYFFKKRSR
ncbi:MAG: hypothetical protein GF347_00805 [Candidatus Moranbacteria bacterium]|nr:hypothetical protein [Candidatus Moranbacteria bacterium]